MKIMGVLFLLLSHVYSILNLISSRVEASFTTLFAECFPTRHLNVDAVRATERSFPSLAVRRISESVYGASCGAGDTHTLPQSSPPLL